MQSQLSLSLLLSIECSISLFSKFGQETKKVTTENVLDLDTKSSICSSIDNSLACVSLIFQDFRHFCRKIHKDHYIFDNDFINMLGLIQAHCNTSHLHRNVNNLEQSTGFVAVYLDLK
jgi:hypothetical protein